MGTVLGGWSFHILDGRLRYVNNYLGKQRDVIHPATPIGSGRHRLSFESSPLEDFAARVVLSVDGVPAGEGVLERTIPVRYSITGGGMTCGWEQGPAVGEGYRAPFEFTGTIHRVVVEVDGEPHRDPEAELDAILSEQ